MQEGVVEVPGEGVQEMQGPPPGLPLLPLAPLQQVQGPDGCWYPWPPAPLPYAPYPEVLGPLVPLDPAMMAAMAWNPQGAVPMMAHMPMDPTMMIPMPMDPSMMAPIMLPMPLDPTMAPMMWDPALAAQGVLPAPMFYWDPALALPEGSMVHHIPASAPATESAVWIEGGQRVEEPAPAAAPQSTVVERRGRGGARGRGRVGVAGYRPPYRQFPDPRPFLPQGRGRGWGRGAPRFPTGPFGCRGSRGARRVWHAGGAGEGLEREVGAAKGEVVGKVGATPDLLQEVPLGRLALG